MPTWIAVSVTQIGFIGAFLFMDGAARGYPKLSSLGVLTALFGVTTAFGSPSSIVSALAALGFWIVAVSLGLVFGRYAVFLSSRVRLSAN